MSLALVRVEVANSEKTSLSFQYLKALQEVDCV